MKRFVPLAIVAALIVAGVVLSLSVGEDNERSSVLLAGRTPAVGQEGQQPATAPATPAITIIEGGFIPPTLSAEEISRATEILASDTRAASLMGSTPYSIREPGIALDSNYDKCGVVLHISMSEPISVEGEWPKAGGEQLTLSSCSAPDGITELMAVIDLNAGELESLGIGSGHPVRSDREGVLRFSYECDNLR